MRYAYGEYDGEPFIGPDDLFKPDKVFQFILQYGEDGLDALDNLEDPSQQALIEAMIEAGLLERDEHTGQLRLTPKALRGIQHQSLLAIFENLKQGSREGHPTRARGRSDERTDGSKAYEFGDPINELDLGATMRNALMRQGGEGKSLPLSINWNDFEIYNTDGQSDVATCVLLDLSGSMMRWGRFYHAKRVALGLCELVRGRYPQDTLDFVGFHSLGENIAEKDLPLVMPKPVTIYDHTVRLRAPLEQATANPDMIPLHFTNLHMGLRVARQVLMRRGAANKQLFIITDGQPTAHIEPGEAGEEMLYLLYPPSERTSEATLKEAMRCMQAGIRFATFALIEDYWAMDWVSFVERLTRLTRGIAFYGTSEDLSSTVIESYLSGKKRKSHVG